MRLCVPANEQWVKKVVKHVEKLRALCRKIKYQVDLHFSIKELSLSCDTHVTGVQV